MVGAAMFSPAWAPPKDNPNCTTTTGDGITTNPVPVSSPGHLVCADIGGVAAKLGVGGADFEGITGIGPHLLDVDDDGSLDIEVAIRDHGFPVLTVEWTSQGTSSLTSDHRIVVAPKADNYFCPFDYAGTNDGDEGLAVINRRVVKSVSNVSVCMVETQICLSGADLEMACGDHFYYVLTGSTGNTLCLCPGVTQCTLDPAEADDPFPLCPANATIASGELSGSAATFATAGSPPCTVSTCLFSSGGTSGCDTFTSNDPFLCSLVE